MKLSLLTAVALTLAGPVFPLPALAQVPSGQVAKPLPHNLALERALANEARRHDDAVAHINQNRRQLEFGHTQALETIEKDSRLSADEKALRKAELTERYEVELKSLDRQRGLEDARHAQQEAEIRGQYGTPSASEQATDVFQANSDPLAKDRALADEAARHDMAVAHIEQNRRQVQFAHKQTLEAIEKDSRLSADAKTLRKAELTERYEVEMRNLDRARRLEDQAHENEVAKIEARHGPAQDQTAGRLHGHISNTDLDEAGTSAAAEQSIPDRLMAVAAQMDQVATRLQDDAMAASDSFVRGLSDWAKAQAEFLAQKPGQPVNQMSKAIINYLTSDYNENDRKLYEGAAHAVEEFRKDPAYFLGSNIDSFIPGGRTGKLGQMTKAADRAVEVARLEKAAATIAEVEQQASNFVGSASGSSRPPRRPRLNPSCNDKNCVPVAISQGIRWRTKGGVKAEIPPMKSGVKWEELPGWLKAHFGNTPINDPNFGPARRLTQAEGIPWTMSKNQIEQELRRAGPGSQGLVFVKQQDGTGHAFNARNVPSASSKEGKVIFWDAQSDWDASFHFDEAVEVSFYRVQ